MSELQRLCDRVEELEGLLGLTMIGRDTILPIAITRAARPLLGLLLRRGQVTHSVAFTALYGDRPEAEQPELELVKIYILRLRRELGPHGIKIKTEWGVGYSMTSEDRKRTCVLLGLDAQARRSTA
jgi:DNA-binding response OmpR family regulator